MAQLYDSYVRLGQINVFNIKQKNTTTTIKLAFFLDKQDKELIDFSLIEFIGENVCLFVFFFLESQDQESKDITSDRILSSLEESIIEVKVVLTDDPFSKSAVLSGINCRTESMSSRHCRIVSSSPSPKSGSTVTSASIMLARASPAAWLARQLWKKAMTFCITLRRKRESACAIRGTAPVSTSRSGV
eukprot:m.244982 g.244982  ORF g.244982 m.244982 type:complete len:188 (+) comp17149_c1_seq19:401-964(+)